METLCGAREVLSSHPGGTDLSAPCVNPVGERGHKGLHRDKHGNTWPQEDSK